MAENRAGETLEFVDERTVACASAVRQSSGQVVVTHKDLRVNAAKMAENRAGETLEFVDERTVACASAVRQSSGQVSKQIKTRMELEII